jgi:hypothetical protein
MKQYWIIMACLATLVASTQTSGLVRSLIELAAFLGLLWLVLSGRSGSHPKETHAKPGQPHL